MLTERQAEVLRVLARSDVPWLTESIGIDVGHRVYVEEIWELARLGCVEVWSRWWPGAPAPTTVPAAMITQHGRIELTWASTESRV